MFSLHADQEGGEVAHDTNATFTKHERLEDVIAPISWKILPVTNLAAFEALPPAAKDRETKKAADTFASGRRNIFVHYVTPILNERRRLLLGSGLTKKNYHKTAAQVWQALETDEAFFWNQTAREVRMCMKKGILSPKGCLIHGGRLDSKKTYVQHAEFAVASYLNLPTPEEHGVTPKAGPLPEDKCAMEKISISPVSCMEDVLSGNCVESMTLGGDKQRSTVASKSVTDVSAFANTQEQELELDKTELLDTLPDRFEYDQKMLYSHFARYDLHEVRKTEGKHRTAMLRQLADLFDKTGKTLFYYYTVPRLCKESYPPTAGETISSNAADVWRFLLGSEKDKWRITSASLKKQLGDGDVGGLGILQLDSLDADVLRLHELAQAALRSRLT